MWIDMNKATKKLSNITYQEDLVFSAHTHESAELTPYIAKREFDFLANALKNTPCTGNGDDHLASCLKCKALSMVGELDK